MSHQDRDRLIISLVLAIVIHGLLVVGLTFADWDIREFPQPSTVYIELPEYESPPPVPRPQISEPELQDEPEPEVPPEEPPPPDEQLAEITPPETPPQEPAPEPAPRQTAPRQTTTAAAPAQPAPVIRQTAPEDHSYVDPVAQQAAAAAARERNRPTAPDPFSFDDPAESGELPSWVAEGAIQPLSSLDMSEQDVLADKEDTLPGFQARLDQILRSLETPESVVTSARRTQSGDTSDTGTDLPGNVDVQWFGGGDRRPLGTLRQPTLLSEDFGNDVPASVVYVFIFEVNADGLVVPGSLILRQSSGYTAADQKVYRAVSTWRFEPAPGAAPVTAIGTLVIERDDLR